VHITNKYSHDKHFQFCSQTLPIRHNLDTMHIEKNVAEHLLSTILEIKGKTKDDKKSRDDLKQLRIRKNQWLAESAESSKIPKAPFVLSREEKYAFCCSLHDLKVPSGYSANWNNHVNIKTLEMKGLKSHDYHVLMQQLLPVLLQHCYTKNKLLYKAIQQISQFFNVLCLKTIKVEDLAVVKRRLVEAVCILEKFFPPSFFDISIHLMLQLADEALASGPVRFRWMYPFERSV